MPWDGPNGFIESPSRRYFIDNRSGSMGYGSWRRFLTFTHISPLMSQRRKSDPMKLRWAAPLRRETLTFGRDPDGEGNCSPRPPSKINLRDNKQNDRIIYCRGRMGLYRPQTALRATPNCPRRRPRRSFDRRAAAKGFRRSRILPRVASISSAGWARAAANAGLPAPGMAFGRRIFSSA